MQVARALPLQQDAPPKQESEAGRRFVFDDSLTDICLKYLDYRGSRTMQFLKLILTAAQKYHLLSQIPSGKNDVFFFVLITVEWLLQFCVSRT